MLSAMNEQNITIMAWDATREGGPFFCPQCEEEVILKKGSVLTPHFAHYPESACAYGTGESEQHRRTKFEIYEALRVHPSVSDLKVERYLKDVRPDVSFVCQGKWNVAIEMQMSPISPAEIAHRTRCYAERGICVLWTLPDNARISPFTPYNTRIWERYLHALYFGKVYYWTGGADLLPAHFESYIQDSILEKYYDEETQKVVLRQKNTYSSVLRNLELDDNVAITDLQPVTRRAAQVGQFTLPDALLWSIPNKRDKRSRN